MVSDFALQDNGLSPQGSFVVRPVRGVRGFSPDGNHFKVEMEGHCLDRSAFDRHLAEMAVAEGAIVRLSTEVEAVKRREDHWLLETNKGAIKARAIVAADGPDSVIGRSAGLVVSTRKAYGLQYKFRPNEELKDESMRLHFGSRYPGGHAWFFDRGDELSVGVVSTSSPRVILDVFCKTLGLDPKERLQVSEGFVPQGGPNPQMAGSWVVTVGDAAGLTNPFSGGGIHSALHSARVASETLVHALEADRTSHLRNYEAEMRATPFCDPALVEARQLMDVMTDRQWNASVALLRDQSLKEGKGGGILTKLIPKGGEMGWSRRLAPIRTALKNYSKYGW
jgi:digeranylgeranylglycerophospholipid reductase